MTIYSQELARGQASAITDQAVYTAPSAGVVVVRDIVLLHSDASPPRTVAVKVVSGTTTTFIVAVPNQPGSTTLHWEGRQVLAPGDVLHVVTDATGFLFWRIMGYVFAS